MECEIFVDGLSSTIKVSSMLALEDGVKIDGMNGSTHVSFEGQCISEGLYEGKCHTSNPIIISGGFPHVFLKFK